MVLGGLTAYARVWPPIVVIESGSMQHGNEVSSLGIADTGDIVIMQAGLSPQDIVTYVEGRARGYSTYGDYGDIILFQRPSEALLVIHRPILRLLWNDTGGGFDVPSLLELERGADWESNEPMPLGLKVGDTLTIHNATFQDLSIQLFISGFVSQVVAQRCTSENPCYVTMGDNNAPNYDRSLVRHSWVVARARGELPWMGLIKLVLGGTYRVGDERVPANSWTWLGVVVLLLIGVPVVLDVVRLKRRRGRRPPEPTDEGGLAPVVSTLEERWERRRTQEASDEDSGLGEGPPKDGEDHGEAQTRHRVYAGIVSPTILPSSICSMRLVILETRWSWVTMRTVFPKSLFKTSNRSRTRCPFSVSNSPVGSSARIRGGSLARETAMAMRCCSPPLNSSGR